MSDKTEWHKTNPLNLRFHKEQINSGKYKRHWWGGRYWVEAKTQSVLEEQWYRTHMGEVIDTEWRKVYTY